ncbi:MAG: thioredoxin family protein [Pararhodobacter sp.]|nr:thioredoxin family protein [Pararhodobacter sp.]
MHRRSFLTLAAGALLMPLTARADWTPYAPGVLQPAMDRGDRIILNFYATWCGTCARQQRVMNDLRAQNPAYDRALTLIQVDWDTYSESALVAAFEVPRRSTIIALKGNQELGRTVAGTSVATIQALFDAALNA